MPRFYCCSSGRHRGVPLVSCAFPVLRSAVQGARQGCSPHSRKRDLNRPPHLRLLKRGGLRQLPPFPTLETERQGCAGIPVGTTSHGRLPIAKILATSLC